jgi:RNA polymerase sigma-70 factor (ECF subfamily)
MAATEMAERTADQVAVDLRDHLEQLHPAAWGWALACCSYRSEEAEEVLQIAYLKVLDGRARFAGRSSVKTWLFGIIRNTAADARRRRMLRLRRTAPESDAVDTVQTGGNPGDDLDAAERAAALRCALSRLSRRQGEVLHLVFYQEMTVEQAGAVLGISTGSARTDYHRGKDRLRQLLTDPERRPHARST